MINTLKPDLVAVGHVTWDYSPGTYDGKKPGGAAAFASATACALGIDSAIVTSSGGDYPFDEVSNGGHIVQNEGSPTTTTFENLYDSDGEREQRLLERARSISEKSVPESWRRPNMLYVGPLTQELPVDCLKWWKPRFSCVVPQGWLRNWGKALPSKVSVNPYPPEGMSNGWDICVVSESEVATDALEAWRKTARILIITKGALGSLLYTEDDDQALEIGTYGSTVKGIGCDTTGAGDVLAAAMLIRYAETGNPLESARFASACAALSTRGIGWSMLPSRYEVEELLAQGSD